MEYISQKVAAYGQFVLVMILIVWITLGQKNPKIFAPPFKFFDPLSFCRPMYDIPIIILLPPPPLKVECYLALVRCRRGPMAKVVNFFCIIKLDKIRDSPGCLRIRSRGGFFLVALHQFRALTPLKKRIYEAKLFRKSLKSFALQTIIGSFLVVSYTTSKIIFEPLF